MIFCRFSSDNYKCDLYAYEEDGEYVIEVATYKYVGDIPLVDLNVLAGKHEKEFFDQNRRQMEWLQTAQQVKLGLPHDGVKFTYKRFVDLKEQIYHLALDGYRVPSDLSSTLDYYDRGIDINAKYAEAIEKRLKGGDAIEILPVDEDDEDDEWEDEDYEDEDPTRRNLDEEE